MMIKVQIHRHNTHNMKHL